MSPMRPATHAAAALSVLCPPRCLGCRGLAAQDLELGLCRRCRGALNSRPGGESELTGLGRVLSATEYRGPAVGLLAALKSGRAPSAAEAVTELILEAWRGPPPRGAIVPVGPAPLRRLQRGLDPVALIATRLGFRFGLALVEPLRRRGARRQQGRSRERRLTDPPRFVARPPVPERVLLVDDVLTTGGTLTSCAAALREAGATDIAAVTFARTPHRATCLSRREA